MAEAGLVDVIVYGGGDIGRFYPPNTLLDDPLDELAAMKSEDWPFFAVFQKGLMRATECSLAGSSSPKAKSALIGTSSRGGPGATPGAVQSR